MTDATQYEELEPHSADGTTLFARKWHPNQETKAEVLVLHGYAEHSGRYREFAHHLARAGIATTAIDYRGHGKAEGRRGHVSDYARFHEDIAAGLALLPQTHPRFVLGHSHGGLLALDHFSQESFGIAGVIVTNPYLALAFEPPKPKVWAGHLLGALLPTVALPTGLPTGGLTHERDVVEAYERDAAVFSTTTGGFFKHSLAAQNRVRALSSFPLPLLFVYSDADPIASPSVNRSFAESLNVDDKTVSLRPGEFHEVLNETKRHTLFSEIDQWIHKHC